MTRYNHIPTLDEAKKAQDGNGLYESYWWVIGWDFNRPTIGRIGIGAHIKQGPYVWVEVGDNCPPGGYKASELTGLEFVFVGPIDCPHELLKR